MRTESDGRGGVVVRPGTLGEVDPESFWRAVEAAVERHLAGDRPTTPVLVRIPGAPRGGLGHLGRLRRLHVRAPGVVLVWLPPLARQAQRA